MPTLPKISADLAAYEEHIYTVLYWLCAECGKHDDAAADIRGEEEGEAPEGSWAWRKAEEAMASGWYLPPVEEAGSLPLLFCLCSDCAKRHGLVVQKKRPNQPPEPTR